jgi:hypothetical protein
MMHLIEKVILGLMFITLLTAMKTVNTDNPNQFNLQRVAHAGGGLRGSTYTNSLEALDYNINRGFLFFELDFDFTSEGSIVCIHDFEMGGSIAFGKPLKHKPTLDQFNYMVANVFDYTNCTLQSLANWMIKNPKATIITDVKNFNNNLIALEKIINKLPNAKARVIPQIYKPDDFFKVKSLGYNNIIWTLYRYSGDDKDVLSKINEFKGPFAITMAIQRSSDKLIKELTVNRNIPVYIHTVNGENDLQKYIKYDFVEVYTDFLSPSGVKEERRVMGREIYHNTPLYNMVTRRIFIPKMCIKNSRQCFQVEMLIKNTTQIRLEIVKKVLLPSPVLSMINKSMDVPLLDSVTGELLIPKICSEIGNMCRQVRLQPLKNNSSVFRIVQNLILPPSLMKFNLKE